MMIVSRESKLRSGGSWLYWVAGFTAFNFISGIANFNIQFSMGLGFTELAGYLVRSGGTASATVGTVFTVFAILLLVALGYFACRGQVWAFIVGIVVLGLDTLLLLFGLPDSLLSIAFHVWAVVSLIGGLRVASRI